MRATPHHRLLQTSYLLYVYSFVLGIPNSLNYVISLIGERVVMGYSGLEAVYTPLIGCDRQDFSRNNRVFYIPKTVGFGFPTVTVSTPRRYWCEFHNFEFNFLTIYCASSKLNGCQHAY